VRHHRSDAYSAEQVLLNKRQVCGGAPKVNWLPTETSVLKVFFDILLAPDSGSLAQMITMLALLAAFDSVDHDTLLQRLHKSCGLQGRVLDCSPHILVDEFNTSACLQPVQHHPKSFSEFHRVRSWN